MTEAEQYAVIYPDRAVLIRDNAGVPAGTTFDRPSPVLVKDLVRGRGPVFDELDSIADEIRNKTPCTLNTAAAVAEDQPPRLRASAVNLPSDSAKAAAEAERFIAEHPKEAKLIQAFGGVPDWPEFNAPAPAVVRALLLNRRQQ
ncbi:MAG: hypothetical protein JO227_17560 [Acetobacteraceae bacterium]|nr:hypothetical protein [Acetobacteraceae bacterium]